MIFVEKIFVKGTFVERASSRGRLANEYLIITSPDSRDDSPRGVTPNLPRGI